MKTKSSKKSHPGKLPSIEIVYQELLQDFSLMRKRNLTVIAAQPKNLLFGLAPILVREGAGRHD